MKPSFIIRRRQRHPHCRKERGATMALVAVAMVAIIAMAALSIDAITLYLANAEAQRSADSAALAAARVISLSGITGTAATATQTLYWQQICGGSTSLATQTAQAVATQNTVGGASASSPSVTYAVGTGTPASDCSTLGAGFAVNPLVVVKVQRTDLPTFFARIWGKTGSSVSATAAAEGFNPSNSGTYVASGIVPVQPRCVKPWIVPNFDPLNPGGCSTATCNTFVSTTDGSISHPGISLGGTSGSGVIGEKFVLIPDCAPNGTCNPLRTGPPWIPIPNRPTGPNAPGPPNLEYLPGQVSQASIAVPSDGTDACNEATSNYAQAIAGCDQSTVYQCGVQNGNTVDLSENPRREDTANGVQCLTHQKTLGLNSVSGQDTLDTTNFPFQIAAGTDNPLKISGNVITSSNSVVTVPIYDSANTIKPSGTSLVTIVGFLQVFINAVDDNGNVSVTILNVSGCSNTLTNSNLPIFGTSPVPVRLVTPP